MAGDVLIYLMFLSVLAVCCLLACSQVPATWLNHPSIISGTVLSHVDTNLLVFSPYAVPPTTTLSHNANGTTTYSTTVIHSNVYGIDNAFAGIPTDNSAIIDVSFSNSVAIPITCQLYFLYNDYPNSTYTVTVNTDLKVSSVRGQYIIVNTGMTPFLSFGMTFMSKISLIVGTANVLRTSGVGYRE